MSTTENNVASETLSANWEALELSSEFGDPSKKTDTAATTDTKDVNLDVAETPEQLAEKTATEDAAKAAEEAKTVEAAKAAEEAAKTTETDTTDSLGELSLDETDAPVIHPENSIKALGQKLGIELADETPEAFYEKFITKEEAQKQFQITKDSLFTELDPEVATALKLKELGVPDNLILNPTKEIDGYLALSDSELVRAELATDPAWTEERINAEIQDLIDSDKLEHQAFKIRNELNKQKTFITSQREDILNQYTQQKQQATTKQQAEERAAIQAALNKASELGTVKIPDKVREAIVTKFNSGLYDKELSSAEVKAAYILQKELLHKVVKHIQNKASESSKQAVTEKLLNVPQTKTPGSGGKQLTEITQDNWAALEKGFG